MKFCYLREFGWRGCHEGPDAGIYCVAPLARLNVSEGMATPLAQEAYLQFFGALGGKPVHHTLANHWDRLIELLYAAERMRELAADPEICSADIRTLVGIPREGVGVVEAPRGTLIHHYRSDGAQAGTEGESRRSRATQSDPHRDQRGESGGRPGARRGYR